MTEKIQGSVKWFSNKKGYGFITPKEGSSVTNDIFVHQSAIHSDGYRTLDEEWDVEFEVGLDDDGKPKAENVTAPGGGACTGVRKVRTHQNRRRRRHGRNEDGEMTGEGGDGHGDGGEAVNNDVSTTHTHAPTETVTAKREPQPLWHDALSEEVKQAFQEKQIRTSTGTLDIALGNSRIKLGTRNYASIARNDFVLAEGSFHCDTDGHAVFEWKRAMRFTDAWNPYLDLPSIVAEVNLTDESVQAVGVDETMNTLMGDTVADPKSALIANGFEMRRVVLTTKRR